MESGLGIDFAVRLGLGGVGAFLAIAVWAKTRSSAWMFIILGVITNYCAVLYEVLAYFGLVRQAVTWMPGQVGIKTVLSAAGALFFITGLGIKLSRRG